MSIIRELFKTRKDGVKLYRHYSDEEKRLLQNETGIVYTEAIDVENAPYTYTELEDGIEYINGYREIPEVITEELAFSKGEKGWWKEAAYESVYDGLNVWTPVQFPAGWSKVI